MLLSLQKSIVEEINTGTKLNAQIMHADKSDKNIITFDRPYTLYIQISFISQHRNKIK